MRIVMDPGSHAEPQPAVAKICAFLHTTNPVGQANPRSCGFLHKNRHHIGLFVCRSAQNHPHHRFAHLIVCRSAQNEPSGALPLMINTVAHGLDAISVNHGCYDQAA